jgi:DnaJ family protein A protein 5
MGQGHSTPQPGSGESGDKLAEKKDYYELLELEQNASPEECVIP